MIRFVIRLAIFLGTSAIGLLVAAWLVPDFGMSAFGFLTAVIVFTLAQGLLSPLVQKATQQYASALMGGIGLISTFVALLLASLFPGGLRISGIATWTLGTVVVWLVTALGAWLLPLALLPEQAGQHTGAGSE